LHDLGHARLFVVAKRNRIDAMLLDEGSNLAIGPRVDRCADTDPDERDRNERFSARK